jgi:hypothetical protein
MARCSAGDRASLASTAVRGPSLYATASSGNLILREVGAFNTTTTACAVGLSVATAAGTVGAGVTEVNESDQTHTILGTVFQVHTADATIAGEARQGSVGAAIGAGVIWTFYDNGLLIPEGTANGVVLTCPTGTGQVLDFYFVWDE